MFLRASSHQHSNSSHDLTPLESLLNRVDSIRLLTDLSDLQADEKHISFPGSCLILAYSQTLTPSEILEIKELFNELQTAKVDLQAAEAGLDSRDRMLSLITSTMDAYSNEETPSCNFIASLIHGVKYVLLHDEEVVENHNFTVQGIESALKHLDQTDEASYRVLNGELFSYCSEPYTILIESPKPVSAPFKSLIKVYVSQLGVRERRERRFRAEKNVKKMERLAMRDPLTDLHNRRKLDQFTDGLLSTDNPEHQRHAALHLDLDFFKAVNDSLGHAAGDELLIRVAHILESLTREQDLVARVGGDEFVIICPDISDEKTATILAQRLINEISQPQAIDNQSCLIGASVGIAFWETGDSIGAADLLNNADLALYSSKATGRRRYRLFDDSLKVQHEQTLISQQEIVTACEQSQIKPVFQAVVSRVDNTLVAIDTKPQWQHPDKGDISLKTALRDVPNSTLYKIDDLMLENSVAEYARAALHNSNSSLILNLSTAYLGTPSAATNVLSALKRHHIPAARVILQFGSDCCQECDGSTCLTTLNKLREEAVTLCVHYEGAMTGDLRSLLQIIPRYVSLSRSAMLGIAEKQVHDFALKNMLSLCKDLGVTLIVPEPGSEVEQRIFKKYEYLHVLHSLVREQATVTSMDDLKLGRRKNKTLVRKAA